MTTAADVVKVGERVTVRVEKVDRGDRKIGLSYVAADKVAMFTQTESLASGLVVIGRDESVAPAVDTSQFPGAKPRQARPSAAQVGQVVEATVDKIETFGLFVTWANGRGLVPTNELGANVRSGDLRKLFPVGATFKAAILEVRADGKVRLSNK